MYPLCIAIGIDAMVRIFSTPQIVDEEPAAEAGAAEGDTAEGEAVTAASLEGAP
jgi:hypothetical protein